MFSKRMKYKKNLIKIYCEKPIAVNSKEIIWLKKNKSFFYLKDLCWI